MSPEKRTELAEVIKNEALCFAIETASVREIDELNILWASMLAMRRAIEKLSIKPGHVLVDGHQKIPSISNKFQNAFVIAQTTLVKGDLRCLPISAASVLAKVARDQFMEKLSEEFPVYDFVGHKGYPTSSHQEALRAHGPSIWHRRTFKGVKEFYETPGKHLSTRQIL
jgi:ribonuclease HII